MRSSFDASFRAICWVIIVVYFARAISLLNLHIPLMSSSNSYVRILLSLVVYSLYVGVKLSNSVSGWYFFPCHLYQTPPFALLRQLRGLSLGWFFFPYHPYQTPPFALLRQLKGLSLGWFFFSCHLFIYFIYLRQLRGYSLGWFFFPCHLYQTAPFALLRRLRGYPWGGSSSPTIHTRLPPLPCYGS